MDRRPSLSGPESAGRVTLTLHGPIGELASALRVLADALDREPAASAVTYTAAVEAKAVGSAPGGLTASLADRFVARLTPTAVEVLAVLCRNAPEVTYGACEPKSGSAVTGWAGC